MATPKKIPDNGLLSLLITSDIPFALVRSNDLFGDLTFIVIAKQDRKRVTKHTVKYVGRWENCPHRPLDLSVAELELKDRNLFREMKQREEFVKIDLGKNGTAFELRFNSFRNHYKNICRYDLLNPTVKPFRSHHRLIDA